MNVRRLVIVFTAINAIMLAYGFMNDYRELRMFAGLGLASGSVWFLLNRREGQQERQEQEER